MDPGRSPQRVGAIHLTNQSRDPLLAARISNAIANTSGSPYGAIGPRSSRYHSPVMVPEPRTIRSYFGGRLISINSASTPLEPASNLRL